MGKRGKAGQAAGRRGQGVGDVALKKEFGIRDAVRMGGDAAVEYVDLSADSVLAQMVEGATVAQPELQDRAIEFANLLDREIETGPLGLESPDG